MPTITGHLLDERNGLSGERKSFPITKVRVLPADRNIDGAPSGLAYTGPRTDVMNGMLDTGADITRISNRVVRELTLPPVGDTSSDSADGSYTTTVHYFHIAFPDPNAPSPPAPEIAPAMWVVQKRLIGTKFLRDNSNFDVIVGMDILQMGRLFVDGPARTVRLEFDDPATR